MEKKEKVKPPITEVIVVNGDKMGNSRTIKANYYKMGVRNFLFTKSDGFSATAVMVKYGKTIKF